MQKMVPISVIGADMTWIEAYNGGDIILRDSLEVSSVTGIAKSVNYKYSFRDTLYVTIHDNRGAYTKKALIKKSKYIYIQKIGINLELLGSDVIIGGI